MADTPIGNLVVNLKYNGTEFHDGIKATKREITRLNSTLRTAKAETELYGKGTESANKQLLVMKDLFKQHNHNIKQQQEQYKKLETRLASYDQEVKAGTLTEKQANKLKAQTTKQMQKVQNEIAKSATKMAQLKGSYKDLAKAQYLANSNLAKYSKHLTTTGEKQEKLGRKVADFGNKWSVASAAIGVTGGLAVREAIKFESAFAGVKKTVDATEFEFKELSKGIRDMAKTMPLGVNELNNIAESAGQLGIEKDNILEFTSTMAKLSATTNMSSTEAANSLARLANITGLSQDKFGNLGSAIVGLGNSFATTEQEITEMALGIAGAGAQLGLADAEILGISTALSSLGIASERGASSMSKALIQMSTAANKGGKELNGFAKIAGVTSKEFANMFKSNPTKALALFVDGLGNASEKGTTAVAMLEEMGIKEIRLRDTLLRAGSASDLFNKAIEKSNEEFAKNNALTNEYSKRAETFESKLTLFKNKMTDTAITMGEELLPVLTDLLDSSEPFIDGIADGVKWFSELDDSTKRFIGTLGVVSVAGGPVISLLGNIISTGGLAKQAIGGLGNAFSEKLLNRAVKKGLGDITTDVAGVGAKAIATQGAVSGLGATAKGTVGIMASIGSAIPIIAGVTAAVGLGYGAWKIWGEEAWNARRDTANFGTEIDDNLEPHLKRFKDNLESVSVTMSGGMGWEKPVEGVTGMMDNINAVAKERIEELEKDFQELPPSIRATLSDSISKSKNTFVGYQEQAEVVQANIKEVYAKASEERRELTDSELAYVKDQTERMAGLMSELSGKTSSESIKVYANLTASVGKMSEKQLRARRKSLNAELFTLKENKEKEKEILEKSFSDGIIDYTEYNRALAKSDEIFKKSQLDVAAKMMVVWEAMGQNKQSIEQNLRVLGLSYDEVASHAEEMEKAVKESAKWTAKSYDNMSKEVEEANKKWNLLDFEDKNANIKSNPKEFIEQITTSENGWKDLDFIIKYANLSTNAKEKLKEGIDAVNGWDKLDPEAKEFLTSTNAGATLARAMLEQGRWKNLTFEQKKAILNTNMNEAQQKIILTKELWKDTKFIKKILEIDYSDPITAKKKVDELIASYTFGDKVTKKPIDVKANYGKVPYAKGKVDGLTSSVQIAQRYAGKGINVDTWTDAGSNAGKVYTWNDAVRRAKSKTVYFTAVTDYVSNLYSGGGIPRNEKGTTFHKGGLAILGDGGRREPYLTPQGHLGLSPSTDTLMNLPTGTKVWSSITKFRSQAGADSRLQPYLDRLPKFATGTDKSFLDRVPNVFANNSQTVQRIEVEEQPGMREVIGLLQSILQSQNKPIVLDSGKLVGGIADKMDGYFGEELI